MFGTIRKNKLYIHIHTLVRDSGVSEPVVREILPILQQKGYIKIVQGRKIGKGTSQIIWLASLTEEEVRKEMKNRNIKYEEVVKGVKG